MANYRYVIKKEKDGCYFVLYPNNIINQEIGRSKYYNSELDCKDALEQFKIFVKMERIDNSDSKYINISKDSGKFKFEYKKDGEVIFFRKEGYDAKVSAEKIIASIYKHIDADLKYE